MNALYEAIHEGCLPGVWSKGVTLARSGAVIAQKSSPGEIVARVFAKDRPTSPKVTLWPEDEDWFCDCGDKNNDVCAHVAATVIAVKNGQMVTQEGAAAGEAAGEKTAKKPVSPFIQYRLSRTRDGLSFDRFIVEGEMEEVLQESLVSLVGGVRSGRIASRTVLTTKEDFAVDGSLQIRKRGVLEAETLRLLLKLLSECEHVLLDGKSVRTSGIPVGPRVHLVEEGAGYRLESAKNPEVSEIFANGVALCGDTLRSWQDPGVRARTFAASESAELFSEILPELRKKVAVEVKVKRLPEVVALSPRVVIHTEKLQGETLTAVARLVYGNPPIAEIHGDRLQVLARGQVPIRDRASEQQWIRKLQSELHLAINQVAKFEGEGAARFRLQAEGWDVEGTAARAFSVQGTLAAQFQWSGAGDEILSLQFATGEGKGAKAEDVLRAWRDQKSFVPLLGGGYAALPVGWLEKYGERVMALLSARDRDGKLPRYFLPEASTLCEELGQEYPGSWAKLKESLRNFERIPDAKLPGDLAAELRHYQREGVNWLSFLRSSGMGALLADDMGLGKTLQTLCAIQGRALIVAPSSVLFGWAEQIAKFRPGLKYSIYHGAGRAIDPKADVILTTYAILRLDQEKIARECWDTAILDEAQTIKNPESQVAMAAHRIRAGFRVALSGTPIENRLDDLWSQFQFLNPGLLGSRGAFQGSVARDAGALRAKIKPFLLRRLKKEVASELPERTETVLHCELSQGERDLYSSILAATRKEVLAKLEDGGSVFQALEALLRLRQASCHPALIPGGLVSGEGARSSSKVDLLLESLSASIEAGHRALVFSQWTSLLDLIEPKLKERAVSFSRLDGSTKNRQEVVNQFQDPTGPSVMLLSLKAGGVGLTLTAADHVYILDPWWNPAVEDQAADRAHRIGQVNPVLIHRLVAKDTVEERILELQRKKQALAQSVLEDAGAAASLTREDLLSLFRDESSRDL